MPRLIETNAPLRTLRIWSAAASTGQEAYSLAMLLCDHFPALANWDVKIVGTDISQSVIEYARRGRYRRLEVNRGLPARMLVKYLVRDGDEWEVTPRLRSMCDFQHANLCEPLPRLPIFDLVLLRNVLLYFPPPSRSLVFQSVHRQMAPGGYLVLGASEQAEDSTDLFTAEFAQSCYFYRPAAGRRLRGTCLTRLRSGRTAAGMLLVATARCPALHPNRNLHRRRAKPMDAQRRATDDALALFHPVTAAWFRAVFGEPTAPQREGWPAIARGESTLILAPTGTGKTLTAFLWCLDRLMLGAQHRRAGARLPRRLYLSAEGTGRGRGAEPARAAGGHREHGAGGGRGGADSRRSACAPEIRRRRSARGSGGIPGRS